MNFWKSIFVAVMLGCSCSITTDSQCDLDGARPVLIANIENQTKTVIDIDSDRGGEIRVMDYGINIKLTIVEIGFSHYDEVVELYEQQGKPIMVQYYILRYPLLDSGEFDFSVRGNIESLQQVLFVKDNALLLSSNLASGSAALQISDVISVIERVRQLRESPNPVMELRGGDSNIFRIFRDR
jgi:hypothetical protein